MSGQLTTVDCRTVELHLPSLDRNGNPVDRGHWVELAVAVMCDAFGGAYEEAVVGHWMDSTHARVREETSRIVSYADESKIDHGLPRLLDLAAEFMREADQEAVLVAVDGNPCPVRASG